MSPNVELGVRYDDGDAETGFGMELGGGVRYADAALGLSVETKARALIAHEDGQYQEWGLSGSVSLDPGRLGRGLALRLSLRLGHGREQRPGHVAAPDHRGHRPATGHGGAGPLHGGGRVRAGRALDPRRLTPYTGLEWAGQGRTLRLGWRYTLGHHLNISLDGERREDGFTRPEHALVLRASLPW